MNSKRNGKDKRNNILNILINIQSVVFDGICFDYNDKLEYKSEESIANRIKLRRGRFDEIKRKEQKINNKLFKALFY